MNNLISIIVPVYNVETYLVECIKSLINQTYVNIEIILVDDGSTDNSGEICDKFAIQDKRIRVIHKKNGGLSDARNYGIKAAIGEWILFVDSDDFIRKDCCEILIKNANELSAEIVVGREKKFIDGCECKISGLSGIQYILDSDKALEYYFYRKYAGYACGKLFKRNVIGNISFPEGKVFEDSFVLFLFLERAHKVIVLKDELYFYRQRKYSIINSSYSKKHMAIILANQIADDHFRKNRANKSIIQAIQSKKFVSSIDILGKAPLKKEWKPERKKLIQIIKDTRKSVLLDSNNSIIVRIMAFLTLINPSIVAIGTKSRKIIKLNRI